MSRISYRYRLWQPRDVRTHGFMDWDTYQRVIGPVIDPAAYQGIYTGTIDGDRPLAALEALFVQFNRHHPADYRGSSLSMGDLVWLDGSVYYCDTVGWVSLPPTSLAPNSLAPD